MFGLSVGLGDVQLIDGRWYVTHGGLLGLARRRRCSGVTTTLQTTMSDPASRRWIFKATVYKSSRSKGFVGYGDADPFNTSALVRGAELRVAETRAVNRALRKAYGISVCSFEELRSFSAQDNFTAALPKANENHSPYRCNGHHPRLRDQLCLLIRKHGLDPTLVKAYAADFCGTANLRDASRDLIESFITHLATEAKTNRDALLCKLNSFAPVEAKP